MIFFLASIIYVLYLILIFYLDTISWFFFFFFHVSGVPCNQFAFQEPGTNAVICSDIIILVRLVKFTVANRTSKSLHCPKMLHSLTFLRARVINFNKFLWYVYFVLLCYFISSVNDPMCDAASIGCTATASDVCDHYELEKLIYIFMPTSTWNQNWFAPLSSVLSRQ